MNCDLEYSPEQSLNEKQYTTIRWKAINFFILKYKI